VCGSTYVSQVRAGLLSSTVLQLRQVILVTRGRGDPRASIACDGAAMQCVAPFSTQVLASEAATHGHTTTSNVGTGSPRPGATATHAPSQPHNAPGESGRPSVATPLPALTRKLSAWPW
jgi:hypothetical protein